LALVRRHRFCLLLTELCDRTLETRVRQPVQREGNFRLEPTQDLVLALHAGIKTLQALADAELDALVVTQLEMQAIDLRYTAPVTAIQAGVIEQVEGRRNHVVAVERHRQ